MLAVDRVYRNNIFYFLANDYWYPYRYYGGGDDDEDGRVDDQRRVSPISHTMGDPIARKKLALRATHNKKVVTTVSLEPYVSKHEPGLYRVTLARSRAQSRHALDPHHRPRHRGQARRRVPQRLGLFLQRPRRGDDATITLISDQNQVLGAGRTDARGLWQVEAPARRSAHS